MAAATTASNDLDAFVTRYSLVAGEDLAERCSIIRSALPAFADPELGIVEIQRRLLASFAGAGSAWSTLTSELERRFDLLGVVLVRGLPFDPGNRLLIALLSSLGPVAGDANPGRHVVHDLRPIDRPPNKPDFELDFHTDSYFRPRPHEVLALLCVQPGLQGGASMLQRTTPNPNIFTPADLAAYRWAMLRPGTAHATLAYYRTGWKLSAAEIRARPTQVAAPTMLIWGMQDVALVSALADDLGQWVPALHVERVAEAGHWVHLEQPDLVNRKLLRHFGHQAVGDG